VQSFITCSEEVEFVQDQDIIDYFTLGKCNALAWEIHKLTGWSLAIVSDLPIKNGDYGGHAFVFDSDAMAVDIMGRRHLDKLLDYWNFCPYITRFHTTKDYEKEMRINWDGDYTKDRKAKYWAKIIVEMLS
jgi:hypothetical protein